MQKMFVPIDVKCSGIATIYVPDGLNQMQAIQYIKNNMRKLELPMDFDPDPDTIVIDEAECEFEDWWV